MITGEIKNRIDSIWDTFWTGGITNSMDILAQMTYLFFMKMLDDAQMTKEANANAFGVAVKDPTFKEGLWHNPETDRDVPYNALRWHVFKNTEAEAMYRTISKDVFVFIKNLNDGKESAYSKFMANATFLIQSPRTLVKVVEGIDSLDMNNRDTMGDVYEYVLGKIYGMKQLSDADIDELERVLWEELGTKQDYEHYTEGMMCGDNVAAFIRSLIGVDRKEAMRLFGDFISGAELNAEQEEFLSSVISYVCENGDITKEIVVNEAPFDEQLHVFNAYFVQLAKYVDNMHNVIIPANHNLWLEIAS